MFTIIFIIAIIALLAGAIYSPKQDSLGKVEEQRYRVVTVSDGYQVQCKQWYGWGTLGDGMDPSTFYSLESAKEAIARCKAREFSIQESGKTVWSE
jgi:hypothetical protein